MKKLISEYISPKSFMRLSHKVLIQNDTSNTQFTSPELISIRELKENGIVLEMPINICQTGHSLTLFFMTSDTIAKKNSPQKGRCEECILEAIAKVENIEINFNDNHMVFADLYFTQNDNKIWEKILQEYADNQETIDHMIIDQFEKKVIK